MSMTENKMTAEDFSSWVLRMRLQRDWNDAECVRRLGCGINQVAVWKREGAPRYIQLACSALAFGLPPWRQPGAMYEGDEDLAEPEIKAAE